MQKHATQLKNYDKNLEELANELGDLRYDALSEFLLHLSKKLKKDSLADRERNRIQLANNLKNASNAVKESSYSIKKAWKICEPFMKE
ncbi:MAG: hypothetical protein COZ18_13040 [Flexibacter sp. CG_4_10_14_3_um_filter_32_15]|nr:MAG: hypothetical protein COZ18_13040 [Flexibacter sp. CG_4_10_14_3_um_filter_32_15]